MQNADAHFRELARAVFFQFVENLPCMVTPVGELQQPAAARHTGRGHLPRDVEIGMVEDRNHAGPDHRIENVQS